VKTRSASARNDFDAPWSSRLKASTAFVILLIAGVSTGCLLSFTTAANPPPVWLGVLVVAAGPAVLLGSCLFAVRGYELKRDALHVQRLLWRTRIPLRGLRDARADGEALRRSFKLWGCSGFLCMAGWFVNRRLGRFRACATDPKRAVVLRFHHRIWVVTPDDPEQFVSRIRELVTLSS
jgi:pimeloyl-ACP methyl ester carboxylesterase